MKTIGFILQYKTILIIHSSTLEMQFLLDNKLSIFFLRWSQTI